MRDNIDRALDLVAFSGLVKAGARVEVTFPDGDKRVLTLEQYVEIPEPLLANARVALVDEKGKI